MGVVSMARTQTMVVRKKAKKRLGKSKTQGRPSRRFTKLHVASEEEMEKEAGRKEEAGKTSKIKKKHFSFARTAGTASPVR